MDVDRLENCKQQARAWFETLRDRLVEAFEALEDALPADAPLANKAAGRFVRTPWDRTDHSGAPGGGGVMAMRKDACSRRSASTSRPFSASSRRNPQRIPGAAEDPRFYANGVSLIAHLHNPPRTGGAHEYPLRRDHQRPGSAAAPT